MAGWVEEPGAAVEPGGLDNPSTLSVLSESVNDLLKTAGRFVDPAIGPARVCSHCLRSLHWLIPAIRTTDCGLGCFLGFQPVGRAGFGTRTAFPALQ